MLINLANIVILVVVQCAHFSSAKTCLLDADCANGPGNLTGECLGGYCCNPDKAMMRHGCMQCAPSDGSCTRCQRNYYFKNEKCRHCPQGEGTAAPVNLNTNSKNNECSSTHFPTPSPPIRMGHDLQLCRKKSCSASDINYCEKQGCLISRVFLNSVKAYKGFEPKFGIDWWAAVDVLRGPNQCASTTSGSHSIYPSGPTVWKPNGEPIWESCECMDYCDSATRLYSRAPCSKNSDCISQACINKMCVPRDQAANCLKAALDWNHTVVCTKCDPNFYLEEDTPNDGKTLRFACQPCNCDSGFCGKDGKCCLESVIEGCAKCDDNRKCSECISRDYVLTDGACRKLDPCKNVNCGAKAVCRIRYPDLPRYGHICLCKDSYFTLTSTDGSTTCFPKTCSNIDGKYTAADCGPGALCAEQKNTPGYTCFCNESVYTGNSSRNAPAVCSLIKDNTANDEEERKNDSGVSAPSPHRDKGHTAEESDTGNDEEKRENDEGGVSAPSPHRKGNVVKDSGGTAPYVVAIVIIIVVAFVFALGGLVYYQQRKKRATEREIAEEMRRRLKWAKTDAVRGTETINPVNSVSMKSSELDIELSESGTRNNTENRTMSVHASALHKKQKRRLSAAAVKSYRSLSLENQVKKTGDQEDQHKPGRQRRKSVFELALIQDRLTKAYRGGQSDEATVVQLRERYGIDISSHRGEWVEVHDGATGRTVYYNLTTHQVQKERPDHWVSIVSKRFNATSSSDS